jgi:hypothetical protein
VTSGTVLSVNVEQANNLNQKEVESTHSMSLPYPDDQHQRVVQLFDIFLSIKQRISKQKESEIK